MTLNELKVGQSGVITAVGGDGACAAVCWIWDLFPGPPSGCKR